MGDATMCGDVDDDGMVIDGLNRIQCVVDLLLAFGRNHRIVHTAITYPFYVRMKKREKKTLCIHDK